eukprot:SAG22_NODE_10695_length_520_cov_1.204276_1_plen_107_part_00
MYELIDGRDGHDVLQQPVTNCSRCRPQSSRVPTCPDGTSAVGATADGEWIVREATLGADPLTGASVPSDELRFLHATNGSVHFFPLQLATFSKSPTTSAARWQLVR